MGDIKVKPSEIEEVVADLHALATRCESYMSFDVSFSQSKGAQRDIYNEALASIRKIAQSQADYINRLAGIIIDDMEAFCELDSAIADCYRATLGGDTS